MNRRGTTLVELVVALALGAIVLAGFARAIVTQRRAERTIANAYRPGVAADEAVRVTAAALARVAADDSLWIRGDTAVEWRAAVGVAIACLAGADSVVVPDSAAATWWEAQPDTGDGVDLALAPGQWATSEIVGVQSRPSGGACGGPQRTLHLRNAVAWGAALPAVRVTRRTRLMLYRGGDGAWWLGERRCTHGDPVSCGAAQPIAGPLLAAPAGLHLSIDSTGSRRAVVITASAGGPRRTDVVVPGTP